MLRFCCRPADCVEKTADFSGLPLLSSRLTLKPRRCPSSWWALWLAEAGEQICPPWSPWQPPYCDSGSAAKTMRTWWKKLLQSKCLLACQLNVQSIVMQSLYCAHLYKLKLFTPKLSPCLVHNVQFLVQSSLSTWNTSECKHWTVYDHERGLDRLRLIEIYIFQFISILNISTCFNNCFWCVDVS